MELAKREFRFDIENLLAAAMASAFPCFAELAARKRSAIAKRGL